MSKQIQLINKLYLQKSRLALLLGWRVLLILIMITALTSLPFLDRLHPKKVANADALSFEWAKAFSGVGGADFSTGSKTVTDGSGNVFIAGYFQGTIDFDPGVGTSNLTSAGSNDTAIVKLDANGDFTWAKKVGGASSDVPTAIQVDANGYIYITGSFNGTVDFDPGAGTSNLTSAGSSDNYILKLDTNGDLVWAKRVGGTSGEYPYKMVIDGSSNLYIAGIFANTVDFDPGAGTSNLTSAGLSDTFILKLDSSGSYVWAKAIGGTQYDEVYSINIDSNYIYATGYFQDTVDFDPGAGTANMTTMVDDVFVLKLDSSGNYVWAKQFGGDQYNYGYGIAADANGNVYTAVYLTGTADFDPGAGTANFTSGGGADIVLSKLDSSGSYVWAKHISGANNQYLITSSFDDEANFYIAGDLYGTADFDPGAGTANLTSAGSNDIFAAKYNSDGEYEWAYRIGGASLDYLNGIDVDINNQVYLTGSFIGTVDFDPGSGTTNLSSGASQIAYLAKLSPVSAPTLADPSTSSVLATSVTLNSNITATGGENATDRGFEYGTTGSYGTSVGEIGSHGTGAFSSSISNLQCGTTYYYRAYATNAAGTAYSAGTTFATDSCGGGLPLGSLNPIQLPIEGFSISINNGSETTVSSQVSLSFVIGADTTAVALSNTPDFAGAIIEPLTGTTKNWLLPSISGMKTVYAKFYNATGQFSSVVSDSITLIINNQDFRSPNPPNTDSDSVIPPITSGRELIQATQQLQRNLGFGLVGSDVKALQVFLNANGFTLATKGAGSPGKETNYFGPRTRAAVKKFQLFFKEQILAPLGLSDPTGVVGEKTREVINK